MHRRTFLRSLALALSASAQPVFSNTLGRKPVRLIKLETRSQPVFKKLAAQMRVGDEIQLRRFHDGYVPQGINTCWRGHIFGFGYSDPTLAKLLDCGQTVHACITRLKDGPQSVIRKAEISLFWERETS